VSPYGDPANRSVVRHSPGSMPEGVPMCGLSRRSHGLWRLLGHTDRALTWEGDVALNAGARG
jgi:hypothetical protein